MPKVKINKKVSIKSDVNLQLGSLYIESNKKTAITKKQYELLKNTNSFKKGRIIIL